MRRIKITDAMMSSHVEWSHLNDGTTILISHSSLVQFGFDTSGCILIFECQE
jgi:hypothetical protein